MQRGKNVGTVILKTEITKMILEYGTRSTFSRHIMAVACRCVKNN